MSSDKNDKWVDDTSREINNKSTNTERSWKLATFNTVSSTM